MDTSFINKVVLITGGASGIGRAAALAFAEAGARVAVCDRDESLGQETVQRIHKAEGEAVFVRVDVTKQEQVNTMADAVVETFGALHYALNSAGVGGLRAKTAEYPVEDWHRVLDINLNGIFYCMQAEIPHILNSGGGAIVNLSSVAGVAGFPGHTAYAASKHAVVGLTKSAALEYVRRGVRINVLCPGFTDTPLVQRMIADEPAHSERLLSGIPARRLGKPEEVAAAALYLCSDEAGFITGHALVLDGGLTAM